MIRWLIKVHFEFVIRFCVSTNNSVLQPEENELSQHAEFFSRDKIHQLVKSMVLALKLPSELINMLLLCNQSNIIFCEIFLSLLWSQEELKKLLLPSPSIDPINFSIFKRDALTYHCLVLRISDYVIASIWKIRHHKFARKLLSKQVWSNNRSSHQVSETTIHAGTFVNFVKPQVLRID